MTTSTTATRDASLLAGACLAALFTFATPRTAAADCTIADAAGDFDGTGILQQVDLPAYRDILAVRATALADGWLAFSMTVGAPIPRDPELARPSVKQTQWAIRTDSDPAVPCGYPVSPGHCQPFDYNLRLVWDGERFGGELVDRTGTGALITPIPFAIDGDTFTLWVHSSAIGSPTRFRMAAGTSDWVTPQQANQAVFGIDAAGPAVCRLQ